MPAAVWARLQRATLDLVRALDFREPSFWDLFLAELRMARERRDAVAARCEVSTFSIRPILLSLPTLSVLARLR